MISDSDYGQRPGMDRVLAITQNQCRYLQIAVRGAIATRRIGGSRSSRATHSTARGCSNCPTSERAQSGDSRSMAKNSGDDRNCASPSSGPSSRIKRAIVV